MRKNKIPLISTWNNLNKLRLPILLFVLFLGHESYAQLPVVDFTLPDVCLSDASATFTNKTTIADNSTAQLTYLWNFGDTNATVANPNTSTATNPSHKYSQAAVYTVTLTATSKDGYQVSKSQPFTVNGDTPVAAFTVMNKNSLCSSDPVVFDNSNSTVNFGNITKVVWYFDYINHPTDAVTYTKDNFPTNHLYSHDYGIFNNPATKNYQVRMVVYSGETCSSTFDQTITIKANPIVDVSTVGEICLLTPPVQITEDRHGFDGTGVFSGIGVSPTGLFNPSVSGSGSFTINYTFTATSGCVYTSSQDIKVNPNPIVTSADVFVLEGGLAKLSATAMGVEPLTYKWTLANGNAATALSRDNILNPTLTASNDASYMLTVTSIDGCSTSIIVNVTVLKSPVIPNTFTPNGDGVNDTWNIEYLDSYLGCTVDIFNRYGYKIYSSIGYTRPWDGTSKGADLPAGTYYYMIDPKNGHKVMTGYLTIIR